jgi:hypothetical protein
MLIVKASPNSEAGKMPPDGLMEAMQAFNEEMVKAGVLISADGLHPTSKATRIQFSGGKKAVIDGPFAETKELIGGYWMIKAASHEEAMQWALKAPAPHGPDQDGEIEVRRVFEPEEFASELAAREVEMRKELEKGK